MGVTVKKAVLWRKEVDNQPGILATTLKPLAEAGADLHSPKSAHSNSKGADGSGGR